MLIGAPPHLSLHNGLVSFWNMEEASGTRVDAVPVGTSNLKTALNSLTANGAPGSATGKIGNGVSLVLASSQSLSINSNSSLQMGAGVRCTFSFWINFTTVATNQAIFNKQGAGGVEYRIIMGLTVIGGISPGFQFGVSSAGTLYNTNVAASNFGAVTTGTWYLVIAQYDGTNISISVNNGTPNTAAYSSDIFSGGNVFNIGRANLMVQNYTNGVVDAAGIWKRVLTAEERTMLYRAGNGVQFPFA